MKTNLNRSTGDKKDTCVNAKPPACVDGIAANDVWTHPATPSDNEDPPGNSADNSRGKFSAKARNDYLARTHSTEDSILIEARRQRARKEQGKGGY